MDITPGDLTHPKVLVLLRSHLDGMHANSPAEHVHALDVSGLQDADISFWTVWKDGDVLGCGALKELTATSAEIKSMRTDPRYLRQGVAARLLEHLLVIAKQRDYVLLSLETGYGPAFEPALALYRKYGFESGEAFGAYKVSEFSQFFHLKL